MLHRAVLMIFHLILRTIVIVKMLQKFGYDRFDSNSRKDDCVNAVQYGNIEHSRKLI